MHGKWFCSEDCSDKDPETKQLKDLYENGITFDNPPDNEEFDENEEDGEIDL